MYTLAQKGDGDGSRGCRLKPRADLQIPSTMENSCKSGVQGPKPVALDAELSRILALRLGSFSSYT